MVKIQEKVDNVMAARLMGRHEINLKRSFLSIQDAHLILLLLQYTVDQLLFAID
jgi:hypothetical protein